MFKRFSANKLRVIYFSVLTLCLVIGISLAINPGRTTESVVAGDKNQAASQEMDIAEADQSVLAAETTNATPQPVPAASQTTPKKQTTTSEKTATVPQSPQPAASPIVAQPEPGSPEPTATEPAQKLVVHLSVNNSYKGAVGVEPGSNQCDVLTQALRDGTISGLDMRYNAYLKTQGVYVIDGQGDSKIINWVYTVNNNQVPFGCSKAYVQNNDEVNWQYVGG